MLSRVAESLYWMCRYVERAENVARFVDVNLRLMLDQPQETTGAQWEALIATTGDRELFEENFGDYTESNVIQFLTLDPDNPNSILRSLYQARENARSVREVISSEMWEQLNTFYLDVRAAAYGQVDVLRTPYEFFAGVRMSGHLFQGVMEATMSHGEAWHFGRLGCLIERADKTSRILDVKYFLLLPSPAAVGSPIDDIQWAALLRSASGFEMYRKRHGKMDPARIVEFLILDREFPRAIRSCLAGAQTSMHAITGSPRGTFRNPAERSLGRLCSHLDYAHVDEMIAEGLHEYLDRFQETLNRVGEGIHDTFFAIKPVPTPVGSGAVMTQQQGDA